MECRGGPGGAPWSGLPNWNSLLLEMKRLGAPTAVAALAILIAVVLGISPELFGELRDQQPELAEALRSSEEVMGRALERALDQRATGYSYVEEDIICTREGDIGRRRVSKSLPADLTALELWLHPHPATFETAGPS